MRQSSTIRLALGALVLAGATAPVWATSNYDYKPNEYAVIDGGNAPNKQLSLASHGSQELGYGLHVYLMAEPAHKVIATLPGIDDSGILDTAPSAYRAAWSPDCRHVAVHFRTERHVVTMLLFGLGDLRPHRVEVPKLFPIATGLREDSETFGMRTDITELTWQSATSFTVTERRIVEVLAPQLPQTLGAYGMPFVDKSGGPPPKGQFMTFAATATGKLTPNGVRITDIKPGHFDEP